MIKVIVWVIVAVLLLYVLAGFLITGAVFKMSYRRFTVASSDCNLNYLYDHYRDNYPRREVTFPSGGETLKGYIYGEENDKALIVFSHGIWSGPEEYLGIITYFVDNGFRVFSYDYTAYNGSTGKSAKGLPQSPIDLDAALTFIENEPSLSSLKKCTLGHSWGAFASTAVLNFDHDVAAACAMSGFNDPLTISVETSKMMLGFFGSLMSPFIGTFNMVLFGKNRKLTAVDGINKANIPVLISHADKDDFIVYGVSSIICKKDLITNPKAEYYTITEEPRNNHNDFFLTADAARETQRVRKEYAELEAKYPKKDVPVEVKREFYVQVDRTRTNVPCLEYYDLVREFFERSLGV